MHRIRSRHDPSALAESLASESIGSPRDRFLELDAYRVQREWKRYEGTPQRDLFRELRTRFLERNATGAGWGAEIGPGPGRFTPYVGDPGAPRVLLDLSEGMLREARRRLRSPRSDAGSLEFVRGDGLRPPLRQSVFHRVVLLGNVVGFAERDAGRLLGAAAELVAPGGTIVVETVAGPGERSRYLSRLPAGAVRRLLAAPINAVRPRLEREGFRQEPRPSGDDEFARWGADTVRAQLAEFDIETTEVLAVAPALGLDAERVAAVRADPRAWKHLMELEEVLGRTSPRQERAAALLIAARRGTPSTGPPARRRD